AIPVQIELIKLLLQKEFAYIAEQAIYFDVSKLSDYGKLSGQKLGEKEIGARSEVVVDSQKRNPQDFALWFFTVGHHAGHTMNWPSPWGNGFPGWHLECSAIIHQHLGETIDIHTGGVDHIGTHHTNEIAQSEAAFAKPLANFWLHNEFLQIEGKKIAKSGGKFNTLSDLKAKGFSPMAYRLLLLQAHYRSQQNFTVEALEAAQSFLCKLEAWADLRFEQIEPVNDDNLDRRLDEVKENITDALGDDLNTPKVLATISKLVSYMDGSGIVPSKHQGFTELLAHIDACLGLGLSHREDITEAQSKLMHKREEARLAGEYGESDKIRNQLAKDGLVINDTPYGPRWHRE
ncbi:MAG TPA: cysteine--tRNA ligase, partial [Candidatus Dormibacteraeota bacterium]|nr:cysteine--tRNA ligase [Candidatus Dormibacteraeota bacterium]